MISGTGRVTGPGGLTKLGPSTLTLNTTNDYNGPATVIGGKLVLGDSGSISNTQVIGVAAGTVFALPAAGCTLGSGQIIRGNGTNEGDQRQPVLLLKMAALRGPLWRASAAGRQAPSIPNALGCGFP